MQVQFIDFDFHILYLCQNLYFMLFILNGCSKFTALSLQINKPLGSILNGFLSQIPTISKIFLACFSIAIS